MTGFVRRIFAVMVIAATPAAALAQGAPTAPAQAPAAGPAVTTTSAPAPSAGQPDPRISEIRQHLERYRELVSQGKLSEAGKELEAIQNLVMH